MTKEIMCPVCKNEAKLFGRPYGLQIGSSLKGENSDVHPVVLVQCEECGTVLGAYRDNELDKK